LRKKIIIYLFIFNDIENVDKRLLKAPPKYEEELKAMKKDVNLVKLSKEDLGAALAKTQESFTAEEIYKYSRPDSVRWNFLI